MITKVPFYKPSLAPYELVEPEFREAYSNGWLAPGKYTERLCEAIKRELCVKYVVPFANCTCAMMCLMGYLKEKTGRNIAIVPDFTFAATWQAAEWNGMTTIVADVGPEGLVDTEYVEGLLKQYKDRVACILAVHVFGNPAPVHRLDKLSTEFDVPVCYDAAHALGIKANEFSIGNNGLAEIFSIGTTKPLSAGEGGLLTTNDVNLAKAMEKAAMHGHRFGELDVEVKSLNGRIQEINSIMAYHALSFLEDNIKERKILADTYDKCFPFYFKSANHSFSIRRSIKPRDGVEPSYKDYTLFVDLVEKEIPFPEKSKLIMEVRDRIVEELFGKGVATKKYYYPNVSNLKCFKKDRNKNIPCCNSQGELLSNGCISIPFFNGIEPQQQRYVLDSLISVCKGLKRSVLC